VKLIPEFSVRMTLSDILYVSYLIPASQIRPFVPEILPLATVNDKAFISIVLFHASRIQFENFPSPHFVYDQINLRTYVKDPQTKSHGVYFLRSGINSATTFFLTRFLNFPWENIHFSIKEEHDKEGNYVRYLVSGDWQGKFNVDVKEDASQTINYLPFSTIEEAVQYLTCPLTGFYGSSLKLKRFKVKHSHIQTKYCEVLNISFPLLTDSGLLTEKEILHPHSILLAPQGQFQVFLPPRAIKF